jgi:hypothetical protein
LADAFPWWTLSLLRMQLHVHSKHER